jgi:hypothetical protein
MTAPGVSRFDKGQTINFEKSLASHSTILMRSALVVERKKVNVDEMPVTIRPGSRND